ncbi:MAG: putative monovalent cation/H+ antiporter subunit A [Candidatus Promineifilaceae bacterium]
MGFADELLLLVLCGALFAALSPFIYRLAHDRTGWIVALYPLSATIYLLTLLPAVLKSEEAFNFVIEWVPSLGINLSFYLDGLSMLMALLVVGMGTLICIYAQGYLHGDKNIGTFYLYLLVFMTAMLGLVLAGNLLTMFMFWELTSISSFLLIGYKYKTYASRAAATQALLTTGAGGLAMFAGLLLLGQVGGSYEFAELFQLSHGAITGSSLYLPILLLVLAGAFTKSAQTPFHYWLPNAMAAPTPVSAYLHSATMVKAGIYLMARLSPLLSETDAWFYIVSIVGAITMTIGAFLSWQNSDLKRILAYSTLSVLGTLTMLLGLGSKSHIAVEAAVIFLLAHALYKGCLFMVAGAVDHEAGTREIDQLSGLRKKMPFTFVAALIAALSKAGIPFLIGFVGKELLYEATLDVPLLWFFTALAVLSNAMVGTSAALVVLKPFFGAEVKSPKAAHEAPLSMWLGPVVLSSFTLAFGLFPGLLDKFATRVGMAISPEVESLHLAIFHFDHGIPLPFVLSVITVALAVSLYWQRAALLPIAAPLKGDRWGPEQWYQLSLRGLQKTASGVTRTLQNGNLRFYLATILIASISLVGVTLLTRAEMVLDWSDSAEISYYEVALLTIMVFAAIMTATFRSRLAAIASLGVVGFSMAILFIFYEAPDLAMTQFAIETLSVVLIALIMGRLPLYSAKAPLIDRTASRFIAAGGGLLMTALVMLTLSVPLNSRLTPEFAARSYIEAHGRNIVNVILVDFRGLDTFGEITVLSIAGIGVYAFSRLRLYDDEVNVEVDEVVSAEIEGGEA